MDERKYARRISKGGFLSTTALIAVMSLSQPAYAADLTISTPLNLSTNDTSIVTTGADNIIITSAGELAYQGNGGASTMTSAGGAISNSGIIRLSGTDSLTITGSIGQTDGQLLIGAGGGAVSVSGTLTNDGTSVVQLTGGSLSVTGGITNSGTLWTTNTITGDVTNTGTFYASGTITVACPTKRYQSLS